MVMKVILICILSYLLGCFNTGYYYIKLFYGQDIRTVGTNVTGAYNAGRVGGKKGFLITFIGDAIKGALPVILCRLFKLDDSITMTGILMVIAGHIFPAQLRFRGGKGLSTAFGAFLAFQPFWILLWIISSIILFPLVRRYTVTCLAAMAVLPLLLFIFDYPIWVLGFFLSYIALIFYACRDNLKDYIKTIAYDGLQKRNRK